MKRLAAIAFMTGVSALAITACSQGTAAKLAGETVDNFLLVVADTQHNRQVLKEYGGLLPDLPRLRTASVLALLEAGKHPPTGYILFKAPPVPRVKTAPDAGLKGKRPATAIPLGALQPWN